MGTFYEDVICQDPRFHSTEACRDLTLLEPSFRAKVQAIIADAATKAIKLWPTETYRSRDRQQMLFEQKLTQLQEVGVHHYGLACDFAMSNDGGKTADWNIQDWSDVLGPLAIEARSRLGRRLAVHVRPAGYSQTGVPRLGSRAGDCGGRSSKIVCRNVVSRTGD